jgi:hypothetical protein
MCHYSTLQSIFTSDFPHALNIFREKNRFFRDAYG